MLRQSKTAFPALLTALAWVLGSCSPQRSSSPGPFSLESISVTSAEQNFRLNRAIEFRFSQPVDPSTISQNTINIAAAAGETIPDPDAPGATLNVSGTPAFGDFSRVDERTIRFQPACPTAGDLFSGGFLPGVRYTIALPAQSTDGIALAALSDGQGLEQGFTLTFRTSDSPNPSEAFFDVSGSPASAIVRAQGDVEPAATRLELAGNSTNRVYFERSAAGQPGRPAGDFLAPLNLYSSSTSQVDVIVELDQPVNPSRANIASDRIGLEYRSSAAGVRPETWEQFAADVNLDRNCTASGSTVRISPGGPLPQGRLLRVFISPDFQDLVGQTNVGPLNDFAVFETEIAIDPLTQMAGATADEILEDFTFGGAGSLEDIDANLGVQRASWGADGRLSSTLDFPGGGGINGNFDVRIPDNTDFVFDTTSQAFSGGANPGQIETQVAIDGVLDCRNFFLPLSSTLRISGPNTARILATADVRIEGRIIVDGNAAEAIGGPATPTTSQPGAAGNGGGGRGGTGSPQATQVSTRGGNGFGAFQLQGAGGQGGESAFNNDGSGFGDSRRPAGGGGGRLGADVLVATGAGSALCRDQSLIGLDAEPGMTGSPTASGAESMAPTARGGASGISPFTDGDSGNDFWGDLLINPGGPSPVVVPGELPSVLAGAGGGAGGDATRTAIYPPTPFFFFGQQLGAGGGGGAGGFSILALGNISFGPQGQITATGGTGGGGQNSNLSNRIGGGSGGGSGGHIVLQSASTIDFSEASPTAPTITALGGQGGAGAFNLGGFDLATISTPESDSRPPSAMEFALGCPPPSTSVIGAGGDGGPGIIQLHAPTTAAIIPPVRVNDFRSMIFPAPVGLDLDGDEGSTWDGLMQPLYVTRSSARSVWIPLGGIYVEPGTGAAEMVELLFKGTDPATGRVQTSAGLVPDQPAVLNGVFGAAPTLPYLDFDGRTIVADLTLLSGDNDIYRRNPNLMRLFEIEVTQGGSMGTLQVASVDANETTGELRLTVEGTGQPLQSFGPGDSFEVIPRFFRVQTNSVQDQLPDGTEIVIRFQATTANADGSPNPLMATPLLSDPASLNSVPNSADFRFFRFLVEFDVVGLASSVAVDTPGPSLDFLRFPFKF